MSARRQQILDIAADLFAHRGFHGVSVAELGAACGISGPALYKHFASKDAMLAEMLVSISQQLLAEGRSRARAAPDPRSAIGALVEGHIDFSLSHRALIVVQDRDWSSLSEAARTQVRSLQRAYVEVWADQLALVHAGLPHDRARAMAHAAFGLINSTPRTGSVPDADLHDLLRSMALGALLSHPIG